MYLQKIVFMFLLIASVYGCQREVPDESPVGLAYLKLNEEISTLNRDESLELTVTAVYTDTSSVENATVDWSSSDESVAVFDSVEKGLLKAVGSGTTTITATIGGDSTNDKLQVFDYVLQTIMVAPANESIPIGLTRQFTAIGTSKDESSEPSKQDDITSEVDWSSNDTAVVLIDNSAVGKGRARGVATGTATITATMGTVSSSTDLRVTAVRLETLEVTPVDSSIALGTSRKLLATGIFSDKSVLDLTDFVTWTSDPENIVSLNRSSGSASVQAVGDAVGATTISARFGDKTGDTVLDVTGGSLQTLIITPVDPSIAVGGRVYLDAYGIFDNNTSQELTDVVAWSSSDPSVAIASNVNNGMIDASLTGDATIDASSDSGILDRTIVTVTSAELESIFIFPPEQTLALNTNYRFKAIGIYSDNRILDLTKQVIWVSSDKEVLGVDNTERQKGTARALKTGKVYLSATLTGSNKGGSAAITISDATLAALQVTPKNPSFAANLKMQFVATGVFTDNTTQDLTDSVVWSSGNNTIIRINNADQSKGLATSLSDGTCDIAASIQSYNAATKAMVSIDGSTDVTITNASLDSIQITPTSFTLAQGFQRQLTATGVYSDNTSFDLTPYATWNTNDKNVLVVSNAEDTKGIVYAKAAGTPQVTAFFDAISGSITISTSSATLSFIQIEPVNPKCIVGWSKDLSAEGVFSNSTTQDLTDFVVWKSSDILVANVNNSLVNRGQVNCIEQGSSIITAAIGSFNAITVITVLP
ncbi:MAG: hypothetical protein GY866_31200 [Proteobacteria bacterium]|nr:hypothetical protein [Pseudomonadota bacterium]